MLSDDNRVAEDRAAYLGRLLKVRTPGPVYINEHGVYTQAPNGAWLMHYGLALDGEWYSLTDDGRALLLEREPANIMPI